LSFVHLLSEPTEEDWLLEGADEPTSASIEASPVPEDPLGYLPMTLLEEEQPHFVV
jgi:hypothetical protein